MHIVVPIDFSPASLNAARFAAEMLNGRDDATLVLFHVYQYAEQYREVGHDLNEVRKNLPGHSYIKLECLAEKSGDFLSTLIRVLRHLDAALVVMGIANKTRMEQLLVGSNCMRIIEKNICPVLVVPEYVESGKIKNVALASDFKNVEASIPLIPVKKILNIFHPSLHIININHEIYISLTEDYQDQRGKLQQMFSEFDPEFYFITTYDFHKTLQQFIQDKNIDLVLTFPRTHSLIDKLVNAGHTSRLVYESSVPVLAAHE